MNSLCLNDTGNYYNYICIHSRGVHLAIVTLKGLTIVLAILLPVNANVDLELPANIAMHAFPINTDLAEKAVSLAIVTASVPRSYSAMPVVSAR